jgi:hypothetical protein
MALTCHPNEIIHILSLYGKQLLEMKPKHYTTLLMKLCLNDLDSLLTLQTTASAASTTATTASAKKVPHPSSTPSTTTATASGIETTLWSNEFINSFQYFLKINQPTTTTTTTAAASESILCEDLIKYFYDDEIQLFYFLESIINSSKGRILHSKIWITFIELNMKKFHFYHLEIIKIEKSLNVSANASINSPVVLDKNAIQVMKIKITELESSILTLENTIMNILDGPNVQYDPGHVLLLCHMFEFEKGERYLLERQHSTDLLLKKLIENEDSKEVFKLLRKEGTKESELFIQVLTYFIDRTLPPSSSSSSSHTTNTNGTKGTVSKKRREIKMKNEGIRKENDGDHRMDSDDDSVDGETKRGKDNDDVDNESK